MRTVVVALVAFALAPTVAHADSRTVTDEVGDIYTSSIISDITQSTATYTRKRVSVRVTHASWRAEWGRNRGATGGKLLFGNRRSFVIVPAADGRTSQLFTLKKFLGCLRDAQPGKCTPMPCRGWRYTKDREALQTGVSVPLRCFRMKPPSRLKVTAFHAIPVIGQGLVVDPVAATPWIKRG